MRTAVIVGTLVGLSLATACENAREQQEKVNKAQAEADKTIAEANREANEKVNEAQAKADEKTVEAQTAFSKLREDYRHEVNSKLTDLDKKIADLEVKAKAEPAKRAELDAKLADIRASREAFVNEYRTIETASATTWDDVKKRVDKSWEALEAKVNHA
jgi:hypothetical protein